MFFLCNIEVALLERVERECVGVTCIVLLCDSGIKCLVFVLCDCGVIILMIFIVSKDPKAVCMVPE
jgi:hypothetical protein